MMMLTTTPAVKARNGFQPVALSDRSRVVRPMLRKQNVNTQVRNVLIGATSAGVTTLR